MTGPSLHLPSDGLLSKWGFGDGDEPDVVWDYLDEHPAPDLPTYQQLDWHAVLISLVRKYLLPVIDQDVEVYEIITSHNPIRAERVDGVEVDDTAHDSAIALTPSGVDIPLLAVLDEVREWWASHKVGSL